MSNMYKLDPKKHEVIRALESAIWDMEQIDPDHEYIYQAYEFLNDAECYTTEEIAEFVIELQVIIASDRIDW